MPSAAKAVLVLIRASAAPAKTGVLKLLCMAILLFLFHHLQKCGEGEKRNWKFREHYTQFGPAAGAYSPGASAPAGRRSTGMPGTRYESSQTCGKVLAWS